MAARGGERTDYVWTVVDRFDVSIASWTDRECWWWSETDSDDEESGAFVRALGHGTFTPRRAIARSAPGTALLGADARSGVRLIGTFRAKRGCGRDEEKEDKQKVLLLCALDSLQRATRGSFRSLTPGRRDELCASAFGVTTDDGFGSRAILEDVHPASLTPRSKAKPRAHSHHGPRGRIRERRAPSTFRILRRRFLSAMRRRRRRLPIRHHRRHLSHRPTPRRRSTPPTSSHGRIHHRARALQRPSRILGPFGRARSSVPAQARYPLAARHLRRLRTRDDDDGTVIRIRSVNPTKSTPRRGRSISRSRLAK